MASLNPQDSYPLLFLLGELSGETKHVFIDQHQTSFNIIDFPELKFQTECLSSGHGWILLLSRETSSLFFFNPLTRQRIDIPYRKHGRFTAVTFTAPPTSPSCTVFVMDAPAGAIKSRLLIDTFCVGQKEKKWIRLTDRKWVDAAFGTYYAKYETIQHVVYLNGILYFVDMRGRISTFNVEDRNWSLIPCKTSSFEGFFYCYLVEYGGDIFAAKKGVNGVLERLYKLKIEGGMAEWEEAKDIGGGVTFFLAPYGGCAVSASLIDQGMEIVAASDTPKTECVVYGFDEGGLKIDRSFDVTPYRWTYVPVWIDRRRS